MAIGLGAAILGGALIGGASSVIGGNKAAKASKSAATANNALQQQIYSQNKAALAPYQTTGSAANGALSALLGLNGANGQQAQNAAFDAFRNSTDYQFRVGEGQKGVLSALGNRGMLESGAAMKSLERYRQGVASGAFNDYYNRLAQQQGVGLTAASAQAGVGQGYANAVSANNNNAANASGNAALNTSNAINGVIQSGLSAYSLNQGLRSSYGAPM